MGMGRSLNDPAALGLSCGRRDPDPWPGIELVPRHWECSVVTPGPPGEPREWGNLDRGRLGSPFSPPLGGRAGDVLSPWGPTPVLGRGHLAPAV